MIIREMSEAECLQVLARARLARLACALENQPYVVPVYLTYDEDSRCLYGFTTPGQKVEWMRTNPLVCVEVDRIASHDQWVSVIAFGRFEELTESPGSDGTLLKAPVRPREVSENTPALSGDSALGQCEDEECEGARERAWRFLKTNPVWSEPGCAAWAARAHRNAAEPLTPLYYRIWIDRVTGHEATRDAKDAISYAAPPLAVR
jgi:nitroimidazol reductase NimA-like FMN-containing flavoprotein (pyridoxamine 5'-phosphate oxidase superfamily)